MTDYSKGKIYKITCNETDRCYIGSTTKTLTKRIKQHKHNHKYWKNGKYNNTTIFKIFEEHGEQNCNIELIIDKPGHRPGFFYLEEYLRKIYKPT